MPHTGVRKGYKQLAFDPGPDGEFGADCMCACPVCGSGYEISSVPCNHFVGDWCFTADHEFGNPRGQWATAAGDLAPVKFDVALDELRTLLDETEWRSEDERDRLVASLPTHLRDALDGWGHLLDERIIGAPGYLGTHEVITNSPASDAWNVHWASNGPKAARHVEKLFREDLKLLREALKQAKRAVLPE